MQIDKNVLLPIQFSFTKSSLGSKKNSMVRKVLTSTDQEQENDQGGYGEWSGDSYDVQLPGALNPPAAVETGREG